MERVILTMDCGGSDSKYCQRSCSEMCLLDSVTHVVAAERVGVFDRGVICQICRYHMGHKEMVKVS